ncbi:Gfo/Idh/MocA family oxidoreductase [soil metagenome]
MIFFFHEFMAQNIDQPLKLGIAGLTHDHVHGILNRPDKGDIKIVGIAEPDKELAMRYMKRYNLNEKLWYPSLEEMLDEAKPEAVAAFNSIFEHQEVVRICAPRKIHVLVEKPLAVNMEHAREMEKLAKENNIQLLTNYETTWYSSNHKAYEIAIEKEELGEIRKVVVHDGHKGPKEIGVSKEFLNWLTDPVMNGGGAIIDFGCYGANLMTWLMKGEKPVSVTAITQTLKPDIYPKVDDEATIVLEYPRAQAVIQASWNWPISRKDMEIYGVTGQIFAINHEKVRLRKNEAVQEESFKAKSLNEPYNDPFTYFAAVVRGTIKPENDLSSLENNMVVVEILDAAVKSAKTGQTINLN